MHNLIYISISALFHGHKAKEREHAWYRGKTSISNTSEPWRDNRTTTNQSYMFPLLFY